MISKYGKPNIIENNEELEVWKYESNRSLKNNRTIIFNENKIISHQKKLKPIPFVIINTLGYGTTILVGFGLIAVMLGHV